MGKTKNLLGVKVSLEGEKADLQHQVADLNEIIGSLENKLKQTQASLEATQSDLYQARADLINAAARERAQLQKILDAQQGLVLMRRALEERTNEIMKIRSVLQTSDTLMGDLGEATSTEIQELGDAQRLIELLASRGGN